jgi:hypothetical protein
MQNDIIKFKVIRQEEKNCIQRIQCDIQQLLRLLGYPEDLIDFDVQMDTSDDAKMAQEMMERDLQIVAQNDAKLAQRLSRQYRN